MRAVAIPMILLMLSASFAGCTSGDPDGDGTSGIDMEILNEMIDDNLQDFINNTSVTINQEIHYHNNTTVVNNYDETNNEFSNTTNVEGQDVTNYNSNNYSFGGMSDFNGSGGHGLYLLDIQFNLSSLLGLEETDYRNNSITGQYWLHDFDSGAEWLENVTIDCGVYYIVGSDDFNSWNENSSLSEESYWVNSDWYSTGWSVYESLGYEGYNITMRDLFHRIAWDHYVRENCDEDYSSGDNFDDLLLFEIPIPAGVAVAGIWNNNYFRGMEEYVWEYEHHNEQHLGSGHYNRIGYGEMMWKTSYYPRDDYCCHLSPFSVDFEFETISWSYHSGGWVGGDGESILSISVDDIYPGYEYRLIVYFTMAPVVSLQ